MNIKPFTVNTLTESFSSAASETKASVCSENSEIDSGRDASKLKPLEVINEDSVAEFDDRVQHIGTNSEWFDNEVNT